MQEEKLWTYYVYETEEGFIKAFEDTIYALEETDDKVCSYYNTNKRIAQDGDNNEWWWTICDTNITEYFNWQTKLKHMPIIKNYIQNYG